ncbi:MAG: GAF and HD-GYP domain-containing protein [Phycisphaerales bacterium]
MSPAELSVPPSADPSAPPGAAEASTLSCQIGPLLAVCATLNQDRPLEWMLDDLLRELRRMVRADAGAVYLVEGDHLRFVCTQSDSRADMVESPRLCGMLTPIFKGIRIPIQGPALAAYVAREGRSLAVPDVYETPDDAPYRFDRTIDEKTGYRTRSMLVLPIGVTGQTPVGVIQAINYISEPGASASPFPDLALQTAEALASMATIVVRNTQLRVQVQKLHLETIFRLATAAEFRDNDTGAHIQRVSMYSEAIAQSLGLPQPKCSELLYATPMHDVGKLGIPDSILTKAGPLTPEEREQMKTHTTIGAQILRGSDNEVIRTAELIAQSHHEKWDGTGYPGGVRGADIPIEGRICAVADVFDALTSKRSYKKAFPLEKAFAIIQKDAGTHFDPEVAAAFMRQRDVVESIQDLYAENVVEDPA